MPPVLTPRSTALVGFAILAFSMGVGRFAFTPILPVMQTEGLVTVASGGALASVHFIGYAMGALCAGFLAGHPKAVLIASCALIGVSTAAMGLTDSDAVWLAARWIAGVCSALVLVVVSAHLVRALAEAGRTDLQGIVFAGVGGGIAIVGFAMLGFMATGVSSNLVWLAFGGATLVAVLALIAPSGALLRRRHTAASPSAPPASGRNWRIILPYGAMGAGYIIPATYLPFMAQQSVSSPMIFGWSWPVFGLAAAFSTLIAARLHRTFSNRRIWAVSQLMMAAGLALPAVWSGLAVIVIGGICVGGTFMVITMAGMKEAHRVTGQASAHRLIAALTAAFAIGQIVGPLIAAWAYEATGSFGYPLLLGSAVLVITLLPMMTPPVRVPNRA